MIILPAIDLMKGKVVRLRQGRKEEATLYEDSPVVFAKKWEKEGAQWLHIVDLDGAFEGHPINLETVRAIISSISIPCELGGGIRSIEAIRLALDVGVERVILGSAACDSMEFLRQVIDQFGSNRVAVGIDARDGQVAVKGWTQTSSWDAIALAQAAVVSGVETIIYTDIATDGMLKGPNIGAMQEMVKSVDANVIASGGVGSVDDVRQLTTIHGLHGVIVGKALYEGQVTLSAIQEVVRTVS